MSLMKYYIETGEIVKIHGISGEVKLYPWCDDPYFVTGLSRLFLDADGQKQVELEKVRVQKNMCLLKIKGIDTVETAREFIGKTVYFAREDVKLPKGRYFAQDVIGSEVIDDNTGKIYGKIANILHPGANDVYEIKSENGDAFLFPAVSEFLGEIDIENKTVRVKPIDGMFENFGGNDDAH